MIIITLKERLKQIFTVPTPTVNTPTVLKERKIEPLKPIYSDKSNGVSEHAVSLKPSPLSFDTSSETNYDGWVEKASKELPNSEYYLQNFSPAQLKELVIANRHGHDISVFADERQTPEQLRFIYIHAEFGEDVSSYIHNTEFDPERIEKRESAQFTMEVMANNQARKKPSLDDVISQAQAVCEQSQVRSSNQPQHEVNPER